MTITRPFFWLREILQERNDVQETHGNVFARRLNERRTTGKYRSLSHRGLSKSAKLSGSRTPLSREQFLRFNNIFVNVVLIVFFVWMLRSLMVFLARG